MVKINKIQALCRSINSFFNALSNNWFPIIIKVNSQRSQQRKRSKKSYEDPLSDEGITVFCGHVRVFSSKYGIKTNFGVI
jgi:hypothetical protein